MSTVLSKNPFRCRQRVLFFLSFLKRSRQRFHTAFFLVHVLSMANLQSPRLQLVCLPCVSPSVSPHTWRPTIGFRPQAGPSNFSVPSRTLQRQLGVSFLQGDLKFGSLEFDFEVFWIRVGDEGELLEGCCCEQWFSLHGTDGSVFSFFWKKNILILAHYTGHFTNNI